MTETGSRPTEAEDPYLLADREAAQLLRDAPWNRFVAIGDSGAEGVTEALPGYATRPWFDRVAEHLRGVRPGLATLNLGQRNLFAAQVRATQLEPALRFAPDLAAVLSGGNDILQRTFDGDAVRTEILGIIEPLRAAGATVFTMGLFDITRSPHVPDRYREQMRERIRRLSEMAREIAAQFGLPHVDLPSHPAGGEEIFSTDGLHLNARGQAIVAAETVRVLGAYLAARRN
jgi:lysophospholipase L1-like esterase